MDSMQRQLVDRRSGLALATMAAYIDLNPVRAGIVEDPKDYRWSGYGEAVAGRKEAVQGLAIISQFFGMEGTKRSEVLKRYRVWVYEEGKERLPDRTTGYKGRPGIKAKMEAMEKNGKGGTIVSIRHKTVDVFLDSPDVKANLDKISAAFGDYVVVNSNTSYLISPKVPSYGNFSINISNKTPSEAVAILQNDVFGPLNINATGGQLSRGAQLAWEKLMTGPPLTLNLKNVPLDELLLRFCEALGPKVVFILTPLQRGDVTRETLVIYSLN